MARSQVLRGEMTQGDRPEWGPLLDAVGEAVTSDFMWMFEVRLEDGSSLHAYKHIDTRCYVHLNAGGRAFFYSADERYRRLPIEQAFAAVFRPLHEITVPDAQIARSWAAVDRLIARSAS